MSDWDRFGLCQNLNSFLSYHQLKLVMILLCPGLRPVEISNYKLSALLLNYMSVMVGPYYLTGLWFLNRFNNVSLRGLFETLTMTLMKRLEISQWKKIIVKWFNTSVAQHLFGNCLPGTELPQSPFKTEFSIESHSRRYRQSLCR